MIVVFILLWVLSGLWSAVHFNDYLNKKYPLAAEPISVFFLLFGALCGFGAALVELIEMTGRRS